MAEPWEQNWSQPTAQAAPWEHEWSAPVAPSKTFVEKLGETWPARIAKGIYSGVTLPGDVYNGTVQMPGLGDRPENGPAPVAPNENSTWLGKALNVPPAAANPYDEVVGRSLDLASVASPVAPRAVSSVAVAGPPTTEALAAAANQGYKTVRESGVEYNPQAVADLAQTTAQGLEKQGFRAGRAPETHANLASMGAPPAGAVSTIDDLQYAKQVFGDILKEPQRYSAADRAAAAIAKQHIEGYIQHTPPADVLAGDAALAGKSLRDADKNYAALKRSEQITGAQDVAEGNAAAANSGRNIDNAYRQRFNAILKSDKQSLGFSPEEIARMETLRDGSRMANALRYTGNMMSGVGGQTTGAIGAWMYNPVLAATPLVGHLLKKGADFSTLRQIKALDEATRMRSALGEQAAGSASMTPAEQLRQTALIKALMNGVNQSSQTPSNDMLMNPALFQGSGR